MDISNPSLTLTPCTPSADQALTTDSFAEFLGGTYQWFTRRFKPGDGRHIRKYDTDPDGHIDGGVRGLIPALVPAEIDKRSGNVYTLFKH